MILYESPVYQTALENMMSSFYRTQICIVRAHPKKGPLHLHFKNKLFVIKR